ncbi:MAG TPA: sugar phosphate nucleotidyltransferase [Bacilli bacterium]|nr:sugar phosphate nucleotidyltransferase [Bacilli bacterium]
MTLVIMAAGMGSRFGGLKQIEPVGQSGEFILDYSIYDAILAGFNKVVFIIKEENYDIFRETVGARIEDKIAVEYVFQNNNNVPDIYTIPDTRVKPLGTGHAILCCKDIVKDNFVVLNADDFYGRNAYKVAKSFFDQNKDTNKEHFCMVSYLVENTVTGKDEVARGICESDNGYLTNLVESKIAKIDDKFIARHMDSEDKFIVNKGQLVSMNFWGFTPRLFEFIEKEFTNFLEDNKNDLEKKEFLITRVVANAIKDNFADVKVLETDSRWLGVTYKEDKDILVQEINKLIENNEYPSNLWSK